MITVSNPNIETRIVISSEYVSLLIVENPHQYFNMVSEIQKAMVGEFSEFTFWENTTQVQPSKLGEILLNGFSLEFENKKILSLLYKKLQNNYLDGEYILSLNKLNAQIGEFIQSLFQTVDFALDYSEVCLEDLLKACNVKPLETYQSFLEKLICYINILTELKHINFFVFIGIKDILSDEDLVALYKHCSLHKVGLLLLESCKKRELLPTERAIIITEDLCEIVENFNIE